MSCGFYYRDLKHDPVDKTDQEELKAFQGGCNCFFKGGHLLRRNLQSCCSMGRGRMLIPRTINLSFRFNVSFASVSVFKLWPFGGIHWSSAVDVTGRSKCKQKYLGCEAMLASQCTKAALEKQTSFSVHCSSSFPEDGCVGPPDKKHTESC